MCVSSKRADEMRPALSGETLVLKRFEFGSGFIAPGSSQMAVCVAEGTKLRVMQVRPGLEQAFGTTVPTTATLVQRVNGHGWPYDALLFANGKEVSLDNIHSGLTVICEPIYTEGPGKDAARPAAARPRELVAVR